MFFSFSKFLIVCCILLIIESFTFAQLSYTKPIEINTKTGISNIAYKLPYRGDNYKFYGTFSFHISGKAFVNNKVYNSVIEAQQLSKQNIGSVQIRILKGSRKKFGRLNPYQTKICGNQLVFMTPMKKKDIPVKFYYRTGLFRRFYRFDKSGAAKRKANLCIDIETLAQYLINLDNAAHFFGLRIKSVTIKRAFINLLLESSISAVLREKNIRFVKYLSPKMNRKYEELFLVEFE